MATEGAAYPVTLDVEYPDTTSRWTTLFRLVLAIPLLIPLMAASWAAGAAAWFAFVYILVRKRYPKWVLDFLVPAYRYIYRVYAYLLLWRDEYGPFDDIGTVRLNIEADEELNRWLPFVKWLLALPHFIIVSILQYAYFVVLVIAWFAILVTGNHPKWAFDFGVGVRRWSLRVDAYSSMFVTDRYPPFSLK